VQFKLLRSEPVSDRTSAAPGTLLNPAAGLVACAEGALRLLEVQPVGKRAMSWADFARGHAPDAGCTLAPHQGSTPC